MSETITTTTARDGIQTLGTVGAEPVGWDGCEDMPEAYGQACAELTAETLTRAGMLVLGVLGDTDLVYMEGDEVCVGLVTPLPSQLIDVTKEDLEESLPSDAEGLPLSFLTAAMAAHAVTGAESVRCDALTFCLEPSQRRMRVCHVRGVCRMWPCDHIRPSAGARHHRRALFFCVEFVQVRTPAGGRRHGACRAHASALPALAGTPGDSWGRLSRRTTRASSAGPFARARARGHTEAGTNPFGIGAACREASSARPYHEGEDPWHPRVADEHARSVCSHNPRGDKDMKSNKAYKDMTREERKAAAQAKAQAALDRIGDGVRSVWSSEAWAQWLQTLTKFHDYSLNNTMLIAMQMPEATRVASYRSWQRDFNRHVRKGEHGIEVLVPMVVKSKLGNEEAPRDDAKEESTERKRLVGFKVGYVFDVSQTEGEPLPTIAERVSGDVEHYDEVMDAICAVSAYPVKVVDGLPPETNGLFSRMGYIAIRASMPQGQTVKTALHELAHSVLHEDPEAEPDRAMREVQAESVAYAVSAALGLDTSGYSFGYVASWAVGKTDEEMHQCMQVVRDAAKDIINRMDIVLAA